MAGGADARAAHATIQGTGPEIPRCGAAYLIIQVKSRYNIWQRSGASYAMTRCATPG